MCIIIIVGEGSAILSKLFCHVQKVLSWKIPLDVLYMGTWAD